MCATSWWKWLICWGGCPPLEESEMVGSEWTEGIISPSESQLALLQHFKNCVAIREEIGGVQMRWLTFDCLVAIVVQCSVEFVDDCVVSFIMLTCPL